MTYIAFSQEWIDAWAREIGSSAEYRAAAERWDWPIILTLCADAARGIPQDVHVYLDLSKGECREARFGTADDVARAAVVLRADGSTWKEVLVGRLDPVAGIMRGSIRLAKGSLTTLAMHAGAYKALLSTVARVASKFPDGF